MSELKGQFAKYVSQASASRILKAKGYVFNKTAKIEIRFDSFGSARVTSATRPQCYVVNTRRGTCTCDDRMFFPELQCRHQIAVNRVLAEKKALVSMPV
jgi:hypothetical protein